MTVKILAVIILYNPEPTVIEKLIKHCLIYPGCDVFLSDNANFSSDVFSNNRVIYHNNGANLGLGAAQNKGLTLALEKNYDYVVLFDQDSQIENNFIERLIFEFELAREKDPTIIAAGPSDSNPRLAPVIRTENKIKKMIIASGCIIAVPELNNVGLMDELLFIDYVDVEWCYRARRKGYSVMQLCNVTMVHTIGEMKSLWFGYQLKYHNYRRYYYFFRNTIIMVKRKYIPARHLLKLREHIFKIPFLDHKWQRIKYMFKGIWDGIKFS